MSRDTEQQQSEEGWTMVDNTKPVKNQTKQKQKPQYRQMSLLKENFCVFSVFNGCKYEKTCYKQHPNSWNMTKFLRTYFGSPFPKEEMDIIKSRVIDVNPVLGKYDLMFKLCNYVETPENWTAKCPNCHTGRQMNIEYSGLSLGICWSEPRGRVVHCHFHYDVIYDFDVNNQEPIFVRFIDNPPVQTRSGSNQEQEQQEQQQRTQENVRLIEIKDNRPNKKKEWFENPMRSSDTEVVMEHISKVDIEMLEQVLQMLENVTEELAHARADMQRIAEKQQEMATQLTIMQSDINRLANKPPIPVVQQPLSRSPLTSSTTRMVTLTSSGPNPNWRSGSRIQPYDGYEEQTNYGRSTRYSEQEPEPEPDEYYEDEY